MITRAELAKHAKDGDCWLLIDGKVYDVSSFVGEHPGGQGAILLNAGNDDNASDNFHDAEHSKKALKSLEDYFIGVIESN